MKAVIVVEDLVVKGECGDGRDEDGQQGGEDGGVEFHC